MQNESRYRSEVTRYRVECAGEMTGRLLDVGGGLGAYLPYFGTKDVTVLDICEEALEQLDWEQKVVGDACHLPFADETFDCVWACSVCMYLNEDIGVFINEALRVLKPGGRLTIELPNPDSVWNTVKRCLGMHCWEKDPDVKHMYTAAELKEYGEVTGEVRFLPAVIDKSLRHCSGAWHTMMLKVEKEK